MPSVDDLISDLRSEGEVVSQGQFTLDRDKAREKMRQFQLADPRAYVLELAQAAALKGATEIEFAIDTDDMIMRCDGRLYDDEDFRELYSSMFVGGDDADLRARRELALGINAAMALNPRWIRVESGTARLELRPGTEDNVATGEHVDRTRVHVKDRFRPGLVAQFFRNVSGRLAEELYLQTRCQHARLRVVLDGKEISKGLALPGGLGMVDIKADGLAGVAGFVFGSEPKLRLVKDGVWITTHPLKKVLPAYCAVIEGDDLRKDVSQANIVGDAAYQRVVQVARQAQSVAVAALVRQLPELDGAQNAWAIHQIKTALMRAKKLERVRGDPHLWEAAALPLWTDARGVSDLLSLRQLIAAADEGGFRYATKYFPTLEPEPRAPIAHLIDNDDVKGLGRLFEEGKDVTRALANMVKRQENEQRFRKRTMTAELSNSICIARARVNGHQTVGEVGVTSVSTGDSRLYLIKEGCLLIGRVVADLPVTGLEIVVESDFTPTQGWDDARRTKPYAWALLQACAVFPEVVDNLATAHLGRVRGGHPSVLENYRRWLLRYLAFATGDKPGATFLNACGFGTKAARRYAREFDDGQALLPRCGVGKLPARPSNGPASDAIIDVPLFPTVESTLVSLRELQAEVDRTGEILYIGDGLPTGVAFGQRPVLRIGHEEWPVLERIFPAKALANCEAAYQTAIRSEAFMRKTEETPELRVPGLRTFQLKTPGGITGAVGIFDLGEASLQKPLARVRLLRSRRFLCEHELKLPFGTVEAVVNCDALQATPDFDGVVRDGALRDVERAVERATAELVQQLAEEFARQPRGPFLRRLLVDAAAAVLGGSWTAEEPDPELLRGLPLFATLSGETVCVGDVAAEKGERGEVLYVDRAVEDRVEERVILILDDFELAALSRIFGPAALQEASEWLSSWRKQKAFAALPRVGELVLAHAESLVTVPLTALDGEVGLRNALGLQTPESVVTVCKDRRRVGEHRFRAPVALVAIVDDAEVAITEDGGLDPKAPRLASIEIGCLAEIPTLIGELVDAWPELDNARRRIGWRHLLDYFVLCASSGPELERLAQVYERAAAIANFPGADERLYCLNDLLAAERAVGEVNYIRSHLRGQPMDPRRVVLTPRPYELQRLPQIVSELQRYDDEWAEEQAGRSRRERAADLVIDPPKDALVTTEAERRGLSVHLWLPRVWSGDPTAVVGRDGKVIESRRLSEIFPCAGVVNGPGLEVARTWASAILSRGQRAWLEKGAYRLYAKLESRLRRKETETIEERAAAIAYLGRAVVGLHRAKASGRKLEKSFVKLYERLLGTPLLKLPGGRFVSLAHALEERPVALEYLSLWAPTAEAHAAPIVLDAPQEAIVSPAPAASTAADPPSGSPAAREPTVEDRFVAALCEELRWSRRGDSQLISDRLLGRLRLVDGKEPRVIANAANDSVLVYRNHPVVAWAIAELDGGRVPLAMVVSAVYTAVNRALKEVGDEDERRFQSALARALLSPEEQNA